MDKIIRGIFLSIGFILIGAFFYVTPLFVHLNSSAQVVNAVISPAPNVPEPFGDYVIPVPLRIVNVRNNSELSAAIKDRKAGDRIVLAPGTYDKINFGYNVSSRATQENPIQFLGEDGVFVKGTNLLGPSHLIFYNIDFTDTVHTNFGASDYKFINCGSLLDSPTKDNFYHTNNSGADYQWINCWIQNSWRPGKTHGGYGIHMAPGQHLPDNIRIAGNVFTGMYRDGISFGDFDGTKVPTKGMVVERNFFYYIEDDAIEMDKWFEGAIIRDNVIGGKTATMVAGISVAPGGPGPVSITGNSIAGYDILPIKFNTEVMDASTDQVTISHNTIVHTSRSGLMWYFAIPVKNLKNLTIKENIITGTGSVYVSENTWNPPGSMIDYNRIYSTMETAQWGIPFRMWDPKSTMGNGNIYSNSLEEFKISQSTRNGFSQHDVWDPTLANPVPVPVGNLPIEVISRWSFNGVVSNPPTPQLPQPVISNIPAVLPVTPTPPSIPAPTPISTPPATSNTTGNEVVVDNGASNGVIITGSWTESTQTIGGGPWQTNYLHDGNSSKGSKSIKFTPNLSKEGNYAVYLYYNPDTNRATNVPVTVNYLGNSEVVMVNQQVNGGIQSGNWKLLGTYPFATGNSGYVTINTTETNGYVIADAIKFVWSGTLNLPTAPATPDRTPPILHINTPSFVINNESWWKNLSQSFSRVIFNLTNAFLALGNDIPTYSSAVSPVTLSGSASDSETGVQMVTWATNRGYSGDTTGTSDWVSSPITLDQGNNFVTVTATDKAGNKTAMEIKIIYTPAAKTISSASNSSSNNFGSVVKKSSSISGQKSVVIDNNSSLVQNPSVTSSLTISYLPPLQTSLRVGEQSENVKLLQRYLVRDKTIYPEGTIDGYYGPAVVKAVQRFQRGNGLIGYGSPETTAYGLAGPMTQKKIMAVMGTAYSVNQPNRFLTETEKQSLIMELRVKLSLILQEIIKLMTEK